MLEVQITHIRFESESLELVRQYTNRIVEVDISRFCPALPEFEEIEPLLIKQIEYITDDVIEEIEFELV